MENKDMEILHSKKNMASYGFGSLLWELLSMAFGAFVFFYYESELGLNVWLTAFGYIIFAMWNAINDPLVGYITDRPFKFTKRWQICINEDGCDANSTFLNSDIRFDFCLS